MKHTLKDLPQFAKRMKLIDEKRLGRLKDARDTKNFKHMITSWADRELNKSRILSEKQRMAIHLMTDFVNNYSHEYIATRLDINASDLSKWRNDPLFLKEMDKEINRRKSFIRLSAFKNVHRAILRGDMKATWNYLKMSGDLKENVEVVDRTGETELSDAQLSAEVARLTNELAIAHEPSNS